MEDPAIPQDVSSTPPGTTPVRGPGAAVTRLLATSAGSGTSSSAQKETRLEDPLLSWSLWAADAVLVSMGVFLLHQTPLRPEFWREWVLGGMALALGGWLGILALPKSGGARSR